MKTSSIACLFLALCFSTQAMAWERVFKFDDDPEDVPPDGFVIEAPPDARPMVVVQRDEKAPTKPNVLAMRGYNHFHLNSVVCLAWFSNIKDGEISVRFCHGGELETARTVGLVWRSQQGKVYSLEWDTLKSQIALIATLDGKRKELEKEEKVAIAANVWTTLSVKFQGDKITCKINDKQIMAVENSQIGGPGKVGLCIQADANIYFDNFRISSEE